MDTTVKEDVLTQDMLDGFAKRVAQHDRDNTFFSADFEALRKAGYLTINVPKELGGRGGLGAAPLEPVREGGFLEREADGGDALRALRVLAARLMPEKRFVREDRES